MVNLGLGVVGSLRDLVVAVDVSRDGAKVIAVVGVEEHVLKSRWFQRLVSWAKHYRRIGSNKKHGYMDKFPRKYVKVLKHLVLSRIYLSTESVGEDLRSRNIAVVLIDDKLVNAIELPEQVLVITEGNIKYTYHKQLMALADNLANYFRILLKNNPKKFREEQERLTK